MAQPIGSQPVQIRSELFARAESAAQALFQYIMTGDQIHWNTFNTIYNNGIYRDQPNTRYLDFNQRFFDHIAALRAREQNPRFENLFQAYLADQPTANPRSHVEFVQWFNETREVMLRGNRGTNAEAYDRLHHRNPHLMEVINTFLHIDAGRETVESFFQFVTTGDDERFVRCQELLGGGLAQEGFIGAVLDSFRLRLSDSSGVLSGYPHQGTLSPEVSALSARCENNRACQDAVAAGNPLQIAFLQFLTQNPDGNLDLFMHAVRLVYEAARTDASSAHLTALRDQPVQLGTGDQRVPVTLGANFVDPLIYLFVRARAQRAAELLAITEPVRAAAAQSELIAIRRESFMQGRERQDQARRDLFRDSFGDAFTAQVGSNPRFANIVYAYESTFLPSAVRDIYVSLGRGGEQGGIFGRGDRSLLNVYPPDLVDFVIRNYSLLAPHMTRDVEGIAAQLAFFRTSVYPAGSLSTRLLELQGRVQNRGVDQQAAMREFLDEFTRSSSTAATVGRPPSEADEEARLFFNQLFYGLDALSVRTGRSTGQILGEIQRGVAEVNMYREAARASLRGALPAYDLISEDVSVVGSSRDLFDFLRNARGDDVTPATADVNSHFASFLTAARAAPEGSFLRRLLVSLNLQTVDPRRADAANLGAERARFMSFCSAYTLLLRSEARRDQLQRDYTAPFVSLVSNNMRRVEWVVRPVQGPETAPRMGERPGSPQDGLDVVFRNNAELDRVMAGYTHLGADGHTQERFYTMPALARALHDAYSRLSSDRGALEAVRRQYGATLADFVSQNLATLSWLSDTPDAIEAVLPQHIYQDQYARGTSLSAFIPGWDPFMTFGNALQRLRSVTPEDVDYPILVQELGRGLVTAVRATPSLSEQRRLEGLPGERARLVSECGSFIVGLRDLARSVSRMRQDSSLSLGANFLTQLDPLINQWIQDAEALAREAEGGSLPTLRARYERLTRSVFTEEDLENALTLARSGASLLLTGSELNTMPMVGGSYGTTLTSGTGGTGLPSLTTPAATPSLAGTSSPVPFVTAPRRFADLITHYRQIPPDAVDRRRLFGLVVSAAINAEEPNLHHFIRSYSPAVRTARERDSAQSVFMREITFSSFRDVYETLSTRPGPAATAVARAEYEDHMRDLRGTYGAAFVSFVEQGLGTRGVTTSAGQSEYSGPLAILTRDTATPATIDALAASTRSALTAALAPSLGDLANRGPLLGALRDIYVTLQHPPAETAIATERRAYEARVANLRETYGGSFVDIVQDLMFRAELRRVFETEANRTGEPLAALRARYGTARVDAVLAESELPPEQRAQIIADPLAFLGRRISTGDLTSLNPAILRRLTQAFEAPRSGTAAAAAQQATQGDFMGDFLAMTQQFPEVFFALRNALNMQSIYSSDRNRMLAQLRFAVTTYERVFGRDYYLFDQFIDRDTFTGNLRRIINDGSFDTTGMSRAVLSRINTPNGVLTPAEIIDLLSSQAGDRLITFGRTPVEAFVGSYLLDQQTDANSALTRAVGLQGTLDQSNTAVARAQQQLSISESAYNNTRSLPPNDPRRIAADADYAASRSAVSTAQATYEANNRAMQGALGGTQTNTSAMLSLTNNLTLIEMTYIGMALQGAGLSAFDRRAAESMIQTLNSIRQRDPLLSQYFLGAAVPALLRICTDADSMVGAFEFIRATVEGAYSQDAAMFGSIRGPRASLIAFFNTLRETASAAASASADYHEQWDQNMATRLPGAVEAVPGAQQFRLRTPGPLFQQRTRTATLMAGQLRPPLISLFPDRFRYAPIGVYLPLTQNPSAGTDPLGIISGARTAAAEAERDLNPTPFTVPLGDIPASMNIAGMRSSAVLAWLARVRGATMQRPRYSNRALRTFAEAAAGTTLTSPVRLLAGLSGIQLTPTGGWRGVATYSRYEDEVAATYRPATTDSAGRPVAAVSAPGSANLSQQLNLNYSSAGVTHVFPIQRTDLQVQYRAAQAETIAPQTGQRTVVSSNNDWYANLLSRFRPFGADGAILFVGRGNSTESLGVTGREEANWRTGFYILAPDGSIIHVQGGQQYLRQPGADGAMRDIAEPLLNYIFAHGESGVGRLRAGAAMRFLGLGDAASLGNLDGGIIGVTVPTGTEGNQVSASFLANVVRYMNAAGADTGTTYRDAQGNTHRVFNMDPRAFETALGLSYSTMLRDRTNRPTRQLTVTGTWRQSAAMERPTEAAAPATAMTRDQYEAGRDVGSRLTRQEYQNLELRVRSVSRDPQGTSLEALFGTTFGGNFESFGGVYGTARWVAHADRYRTSGWRLDAQYANVDVGREFVSTIANFENNFRNMELFYLNVEHYERDRARNTAFWAAMNMTYAQMSNYAPSATSPQAPPGSDQFFFNLALMYMVRRHRIMIAGGREMPFLESSQYIDESIRRIQMQDPTRMQQGYAGLGTFLQNALRSEIWRGTLGYAFDGERIRVSWVGGVEARPDPIRGGNTTSGGVTGLFLFGPNPTTRWFMQFDGRVFQVPSTVVQPTRGAGGLVLQPTRDANGVIRNARPETWMQRYVSLYASVGIPGSTGGATTSVDVPVTMPPHAPSAQVMRVDGPTGIIQLVRDHIVEIGEQAQDPQNRRTITPHTYDVIADVNLHQQVVARGTHGLTLAAAGQLYIRRQYNPAGSASPMTLVIGNQADFDNWTEQAVRTAGGVPSNSAHYIGDGFVYTLNIADGAPGSNQYLVAIGGLPAPPAGFGFRATIGVTIPAESSPRIGGRPGMTAADVANSTTVGFMARLFQSQNSRHFLGAMLANRRLEDDQLRQLRVTYLAEQRLSVPGAAVQETGSFYVYFDYTESATGVLTVGTQEDYLRYLNTARISGGLGVSYVRLTPGPIGRPQDSHEWTFDAFGYVGHERTSTPLHVGADGTLDTSGYLAASHGGRVFWGAGLGAQYTRGRGTPSAQTFGVSISAGFGFPQPGVSLTDEMRAAQYLPPYAPAQVAGSVYESGHFLVNVRYSW